MGYLKERIMGTEKGEEQTPTLGSLHGEGEFTQNLTLKTRGDLLPEFLLAVGL